MAKAKSERVRRMIAEFMTWHNEGFSIYQIADKFQLSAHTVYQYLQEIADANGVTRKSLLQRVRSQTAKTALLEEERQVHVSVQELTTDFANARSAIDSICNKIDNMLKQEERL